MAYIKLENYSKIFGTGDQKVYANKDISFEMEKGQLMVIVGSSGAGKSTLLNTLGGMDSATEGKVIINGTDIAQFSEKELTTYRRKQLALSSNFITSSLT